MNTPQNSSFPDPPAFDVVADKLKGLLDAVQEAIAEGTLHVPEYVRWQAESAIDFALAPNLVRHKAKLFLRDHGQDAKDEDEVEDPGFETEQIPNNGLCLTVPGFMVRVLKATSDGSIPPPGISLTRQNYYKQLQAMIDFEEFRNGNTRVQPTWGLVIYWEVDAKYNLLKMSVALPVALTKNDNGRQVVECAFNEPFWTRPLPNVISIDEVQPPTDLDVPFEEEPAEQTGEEPKDE